MQFGKITIDSEGYVMIPIFIGGACLDHYEFDSRSIKTVGDRDFGLMLLRQKTKWFTPELEHDFIEASDYILANPL